MIEQVTVGVASLWNEGFMDRRLFKMLNHISSRKELAELKYFILAQDFPEKGVLELDSFKSKMNLEVLYYNSKDIACYPDIRLTCAENIKTPFMYYHDDDYDYIGEFSPWLLEIAKGCKVLDKFPEIGSINYNSHIKPLGMLHIRFPLRVCNMQGRLQRTSDLVNSPDMREYRKLWYYVRNLEDQANCISQLHSNKLSIINSTNFGPKSPKTGNSEISVARSSSVGKGVFGVPMGHRIKELYIITANLPELFQHYKELANIFIERYNSDLEDWKILVDLVSDTKVEQGPYNPPDYIRNRFLELKNNPDWAYIMLNEFYKSIGIIDHNETRIKRY